MNKLNVEGGEIAIKNKNGDLAIIPKNKIQLIKSLIKQGDYKKVDTFVSMLPKMATTAGDGTVIPDKEDEPKKKLTRQQRKDAAIEKYGKGIKTRFIYQDLYDKEIPASTITNQKYIYNEYSETDLPPDLYKKNQEYRERDQKYNDWKDKFYNEKVIPAGTNSVLKQETKIPFGGDPIPQWRMSEDDKWYKKYQESGFDNPDKMEGFKEYAAKKKWKEEGDLNIAEYHWNKDPRTSNPVNNEATSWRKMIEGRDDIKNKELLFASLMDEGADAFTYTYQGGTQDVGYDGYGTFGLDTFGSRYKEFQEKGYLAKDGIGDRIELASATNELDQNVTSANFTNLNDVLSAKRAFILSGENAINRKAKDLGITLSQTAMDYFTVASYNFGEGGARSMLAAYNEAGILKDDAFMNDDSYEGYRQPHKHAKRRVEAINMLRGEKTMTPKKKIKPEEPKGEYALLESHPDYLNNK